MTHYRLPMRWADLDQLNHVNNVVYLTYAAEARAALVEEGVLDRDLSPLTIAIDFVRPMALSRRPVDVEQEPDGDVLTQVVTQEIDGARIVFAKVVTRLGVPGPLGAARVHGQTYPLRGRRGDVDVSGHVDLVRVFEYFQESRVIWMSQGGRERKIGPIVVAHLQVEYGAPVPWRPEPWETAVEVARFGGKSFTLESEWRDGSTVLARSTAVLVGFDVESQTSRALSDGERAYLEGLRRS